jgi:putative phage-type endonuclease
MYTKALENAGDTIGCASNMIRSVAQQSCPTLNPVLSTVAKRKKVVKKKESKSTTTTPKIHPQVQRLLQIPKIEQKTPEWYEARHNLITASDFAQALGKGKFGTQKQLIMKKVEPNTDTNAKSNIFFEWGNLFEPVACMVYAKMQNTRVHEFGLLQHPRHSYLGASPDGITDKGIMLEIKCPLKRKIEVGGDVPEQYYFQIQGQLDVCDLDDCHYFECEFIKFDAYDAFKETYEKQPIGTWNGAFSGNECIMCETSMINNISCSQATDIYPQPISYWILVKYNLKHIQRDKVFIAEKIQKLGEVWKRILYYRENPSAYQMELKKNITITTQTMNPLNHLNPLNSLKTLHGEEDAAQHVEMMKPVSLNGYRLVKLDD